MLSAPKGQAEIHDSHPVQVSLSISNVAIRSSSKKLEKWKNGMTEYRVKQNRNAR